jgi:hypothetical protein
MTLVERLRARRDSLSHQAADKIVALLSQLNTPRIYVRMASSVRGTESREITLGPYLNATITKRDSGQTILGATPSDEEGDATVLAVANWNGDGWLRHEGAREKGMVYDAVWFHTNVPPWSSESH